MWSFGSLLLNIPIIIYVILSSKAPSDFAERIGYINDNWIIYSAHWKLEFLFMTMITIGAVSFAFNLKKASWPWISVGQIILLMTYPLMLGAYHNTSIEIADMANQIAVVIFIFGNIVLLSGLFHLYWTDTILQKWLRYTAILLSGFATIIFCIVYVGVISWRQAMMIGPLINILYLINAFYGWKLTPPSTRSIPLKNPASSTRR
ncbi:MAG: hypothetical protein ABFS12_16740 [Bacteroidota bacterium]